MFYLNPKLAADVFDGEYIIANLDTGLYYSVQGVAVSLINGLPFQSPKEVINELLEAFSEHKLTLEAELNVIFEELLKEEIIKKSDEEIHSTGSNFTLPETYIAPRFNRYADMQDLLLLDPIHDVDEEGWTVQKDND